MTGHCSHEHESSTHARLGWAGRVDLGVARFGEVFDICYIAELSNRHRPGSSSALLKLSGPARHTLYAALIEQEDKGP